MNTVLFKLLNESARVPQRATHGSAGFDLYATEDYVIVPNAQAKIGTGVAMAVPTGCAGFVWPRSSLAAKYQMDIHAGLIDADYREEIHVLAINHGDRTIEIRKGDRIAQLVIQQVVTASWEVDDLPDPGTRHGGFGSTGV